MRVSAFAIASSSVAQLTYGENLADMYRRGAYFVDKILKGGKPADFRRTGHQVRADYQP